ncbi:hypothetical protein A2U01_0113932, partial [Trifolium medium]|nr:hypothetical protein [Trifolium medium]
MWNSRNRIFTTVHVCPMPRKNNVKATPEVTRFLVPDEKSH